VLVGLKIKIIIMMMHFFYSENYSQILAVHTNMSIGSWRKSAMMIEAEKLNRQRNKKDESAKCPPVMPRALPEARRCKEYKRFRRS